MFTLTAEQSAKINEWAKNHNCRIVYEGAIGGKISYCFTPTGLGVIEKVKCACGQEIDVTEYDEW